MRNEWGAVAIEKRAEIPNHEPLQLRLIAQIHQEWHIRYPENLETSILGLGELEHMNQLYASGMLQRIKNYNAGNAASSPGSVKIMASPSRLFYQNLVGVWGYRGINCYTHLRR